MLSRIGSLKCFILNLISLNRFDFVTSVGQFVYSLLPKCDEVINLQVACFAGGF